jgi:uncharacterized membrane protein
LILPKCFRDRDFAFALILTAVCVVLCLSPTGFENRQTGHTLQARARVVSIDDSDIERAMILKTGLQRLTVDILSGPFKGQQAAAINLLTGKLELDEMYAPGESILLEFAARDGKISWAQARGSYRIGFEVLLFALFGVLLAVVAGWTGIKALLSFVLCALLIWKVLVPCFLKGYDPILIALAVVAMLTAAISFLIGGVGRKGLITFLGSTLGLVLTCVLAMIFTKVFRIHGAVRPFAETVLYSGFYFLDLNRIFIAGIFIASTGAVMDLAMDIAASMHEVQQRQPEISVRELMRSGMAVGRAVIGPMTTTLLLAYSGSYITMLMLFMGQGIPMANIFNLNLVAAEILNTCVGSFGLVTVAPFTAVVGGLIYGWRRQPTNSSLSIGDRRSDSGAKAAAGAEIVAG